MTKKLLKIAEKFYRRWDFPNSIDIIDGKHIVMEQPFNSRCQYRNYKGKDGIILLAMIGWEYEFFYVDVGVNGCKSEGEIRSKCALKNVLEENTLNVSSSTVLPDRNAPVPYVCTGDDASPRSTYIMKPYPQT